MKLLKLTVVLAVSGLFVGAGTAAYARDGETLPPPPGSQTFRFTADQGQSTALNGSTITLAPGSILPTGIFKADILEIGPELYSWDLRDTDYGVELTRDNSSGYGYIAYYNANTWEGWFDVSSGYFGEFHPAFVSATYEFEGGNDVTGGGYLDFNVYTYSSGGVDPYASGSWSPVPDALNSFQLCALALAALGAAHLFFRRQAAVLERK